MRFFTKYKGIHILFWTADLLFWSYASHKTYHAPILGALLNTAVWLFFQALLVYPIIYWLLPKYFYQKKYFRFSGASVGLLVLTALVITWAESVLITTQSPKASNTIDWLNFFLYIAMTNFYTCFVFIAAKVIKDKLATDRHHRAVEKERTESELRFLKSQMNPHFLFNAINSIYVLIKKDQDMAANTLATFADMLRYQLYECNTPAIPIEREIDYLNNYVQLEKLRKGKSLQLDYQVGEEVRNFDIAPLLLIPFVENAFKYVSANTNKENKILLHLNYKNNNFTLQVENTTEPLLQPTTAGGIGLENVKRQLELIYKGNYQLNITPGTTDYKVMLTIDIV
ncbi:histidine kinase [Chitinophaga dinghuensis]|uniref:Histidine kinase n=1 Tax=Chitinophaga dinghuensis TaxID=1539050 RepID=A0A327W342_9BACT|nr:histidine kinase [Chitinophaga dinghuensis]RAJ83679.1 histidine kinase [Chitinophaga dinghuensis]